MCVHVCVHVYKGEGGLGGGGALLWLLTLNITEDSILICGKEEEYWLCCAWCTQTLLLLGGGGGGVSVCVCETEGEGEGQEKVCVNGGGGAECVCACVCVCVCM